MAIATKNYWPSMSDIQEAVQSPKLCFSDTDLKKGEPVLTALGLPRPICGTFASVYELESGGHSYAIKCFLRNIPDQHECYAKIAKHLVSSGLPYFVTFDYLADGIMVHGQKFPIVKMEWVEGRPLNEFIQTNLNEPDALRDLEDRWVSLLQDLQSKDIGHGDLQHGNVLVDNDGSLRLIDYDGMWVPAFKGRSSNETGHPDYQSPLRSAADFDDSIDDFAGTLIRIALRALARDPSLWKKHDNGENLLFKRQDFLDPRQSKVFAALRTLGDDVIDPGLAQLEAACTGKSKPKKVKATAAPSPAKATSPSVNHGHKEKGKKSRKDKKRARKAQRAQQARPAPAASAAPAAPSAPAAPAASAAPAAPAARAAPAASAPAGGPSWLQDHLASGGVGSAGSGAPAPSKATQSTASPKSASPKSKTASPKSVSPTPAPAAPVQQAKPVKAPRARPRQSNPQHAESSAIGSLFQVAIHVMVMFPGGYVAWKSDLDVMRWGGITALALGMITLSAFFLFPRAHRMTSTLFFGFAGLAILGNIIFELFATGSFGPNGENAMEYGVRGVLLVASLVGFFTGRRRP